MGWTFCCSRRKDLIQERIGGWRHLEEGKPTRKCIAHCYRGNPYRGVLWTVWVILNEDGTEKDRFIGCDLLEYVKAQGPGYEWGYKDLCESMGPAYFSCPLKYLDMVPIPDSPYAAKWREGVREYHAKRSRKLVVGQTYPTIKGIKIGSRRVVEITVNQLRPLLGAAKMEDGEIIPEVKFKKRHIAEEAPANA